MCDDIISLNIEAARVIGVLVLIIDHLLGADVVLRHQLADALDITSNLNVTVVVVVLNINRDFSANAIRHSVTP